VNFRESEQYLLSLGNEVSAMKLGLENISRLLTALGDPQSKYLKVQVAGTNGKGSVCAFLDAICNAAGLRVGLFASPHLVSITERIRINGHDISENNFAGFATRVRETAESLLVKGEINNCPTFFEQVTAIALLAFADAGVELAILETGLGGRLDATTAANAEIAAITQIDYDHQEYLGGTLVEIAAEKAAIIRAGSMVVVAEQDPVAAQVIEERCRNLGIEPLRAANVRTTRGSGWLNFATDHADYRVTELGLLGAHQIQNAKVAIMLAELLQARFQISTQNIIAGLQNARHPGRLEFQGQFLFDGAHNPAGARALSAFLDSSVMQPVTLVFGVMQGKNPAEMAEALFPKARNIILTQSDNSRALTPEQILALLPESLRRQEPVVISSVETALQIAKELAGQDGFILITGSLYLVGEAKKILNN
jgi:dihydrofolate synthase/folylpolyglutamate synthase